MCGVSGGRQNGHVLLCYSQQCYMDCRMNTCYYVIQSAVLGGLPNEHVLLCHKVSSVRWTAE